jgi:hypothetical protein
MLYCKCPVPSKFLQNGVHRTDSSAWGSTEQQSQQSRKATRVFIGPMIEKLEIAP